MRLVLCTALLLSGCANDIAPSGATSESAHPLEGAWQLEAVQASTSCAELDMLGAVDVTRATFTRDAEGWILATAGQQMRVAEVASDVWVGHLSAPWDGCRFQSETRWDFEAVGPTSFAAWRTISVQVDGGDCGVAAGACTITQSVRGVR